MYELVKVSETCFYIQSPAKIGLVHIGKDEVCLIDSGNDKDAGKKVKRILDANGWTLRAIYNTHSHADHIGGNQYLQKQTGCMVYAPGIERDFTEHPLLEPSFLYGGNPPKELRHKFLMAQGSSALPLTEDCLPPNLQIIPLPGHSWDMVGFRSEDGVVYLADCLSSKETLDKYGVSFLVNVQDYPEYHVPIKNLPEKGQDYLLKAVALLEQYADFIPSVGQEWRQNPWYGFKTLTLDYNGSNQLKEDLTTLTGGYRNLQSSTQRIKDKYETRELNYTDTLSWQEILAFSAKSDVVTPAILSREGYESALPRIEKLKELSSTIMPLQEQLFSTYSPEIVREINGKEVHAKLTGQFASGLTRAFSGEYRTLIAGMQPYLKSGKLKYRQAVECAELLRRLQSAQAEFETQEAAGRGFIGACYRGIHTDWTHVEDTLNTLRRYYESGSGAFYALARMAPSEFEEGRNEFSADAEELQNEIQLVEEAKQRVSQHFMPQVLDLEKDSYVKCLQKLELCLAEFDKLANWRSFLELLKQIDQAELLPYIDTAIKEAIAPENIVGAFKRAFYKQWIEYIVFAVPTLAAFTRSRQDQAVEIFTNKDEIQYRISKLQIKAELSQKRPSLDLTAGGSAVSILRREGQKKRKQMPIRKLLSETGMLVQQIKPCFLMSPLSVSTFLEPGKISFDMVIFDEASQIFPQDAIGAIYRGKQLIVVGDSRQMPPSNFFSAALDVDDDDEETGDITDFESILDICSAVFTTQRLAWHYRSHYEQLIAFSNLNFYNNTLVTFPSSSKDHKGIGVDYYYVGGTFDRRSKTNREEAEFIVDLIYQNIEKYPERSLGVVAFSVAQQNLIDRLLSKRREADPSHEAFFGSDNREPFFIKNLETVQGDERDTIIFSVAYAKDRQGRFIQNFGPLNRIGGERRLNVAVTRAKDNVQLVSSIRYTDINLSNSGSEGVRLLRAYLDYAQNGEDALERAITVSGEDQFDSFFEQEVCDFLRDHGYTVDTQVGCSGYRIDLGLRKPNSSNYVLAIECDGATYHSAKNARDRDSLRQRVLENMGWHFYRIWSTDWFRNTSVEKERLLNAVKAALEQDDGRDEPEADSQPRSEMTPEQTAEMAFSEVIPETQIEFEKYQALNAQEIFRYCRNDLWRAIRMILQTEAPLSEEYLLKRIVFYFQREKVTKVVQQEYERMMRGCEHDGIIRRNGFLYLKGMTKYSFRVPGVKREIKYISPEELSMGMYAVIKQNVSVTKDGLYRTLTNLLGFSRTGSGIVSRYDSILGDLIKYQLVRDENGIISVVV